MLLVSCITLKGKLRDLPGGPLGKTPIAGSTGLIPGQGMPWHGQKRKKGKLICKDVSMLI